MATFGDHIAKGDKAKKSTTVDLDARTIEVHATTKKQASDPSALYHKWVFDLAECADEDIWKMAARGFVIDAQRDYREDEDNKDDFWADRTLVYPEDFTTERRTAKPSKKTALKYLDTLTVAERRALLDELEAEDAEGADDSSEA